MIEVAQESLRTLEKKLEQNHVQLIGRISLQQAYDKKQTIRKKGKKEIEVAQRLIETTTRELNEHVKGEFGKKIKEVLDRQKQVLENF